MFCPHCNTESRVGFTRCAACGEELVSARPVAPAGDSIAMVWRGGDPVVLSAALAVLQDAGISYHILTTSDHLAFGLAMPRPMQEVFVYSSDAAHARELLAEFTDPFPLTTEEPSAEESEPSLDEPDSSKPQP